MSTALAVVTTEHLTDVVRDEDTYSSIVNSLQYAGASTAMDLLLGTLAAWLIVRCRAPLAGLLDALAMLPLAVPGSPADSQATLRWRPHRKPCPSPPISCRRSC